MPARSVPNRSMKIEISAGARNDTARPVVVYRPKATPSLPSAEIRSISVRAADWIGPTNRHSSSPQTQKASAPDNVINVSPTAIMATSEPTMTGLEPSRSSRMPPSTAPTAAITLALTPNSRMLASEML